MKYLVDTDRIIAYLRRVDAVRRRLDELEPEGVAISILSVAELYDGVYGSTEPERTEQGLDQFLQRQLPVLGVDEETARIFGRERARLRRAGGLIGDIDLLIAATALRHDLTVLTNNRRHFEAVEGLEILSA